MATIGVMTTEFDEPTLERVADRIVEHKITAVQLQLGSTVRDIATTDSLLRGLDVLGSRIDEGLAVYARGVFAERGISVAAVDGTYNTDPSGRRPAAAQS